MTPASLDVISKLAFPTCSFWYRLEGSGRLKPPLLCGRKSLAGSADLVKPAHFLKERVAIGSRVFSNQETGNSVMVRSHDSLGHTPKRYSLSFYFLVTGTASTRARSVASFSLIASRAALGFRRT